MRRVPVWVLCALLLIGVALRVQAMQGDLWFDEVSSIEFARRVASPLGIFTSVHHDNNHHLNTLTLYYLGDGRASIAYRWMPWLASCLLLVWVAVRCGRRATVEAIAAAVLVGGSFFLVIPTTEARGYAPMLLLVFAAWRCLSMLLEGRDGPWASLFGVLASLALLFHLTALTFLVGSAVWVLGSGPRLASRPGRAVGTLARILWLPASTAVALYLVDVRSWEVGGGPFVEKSEAAGRAAALALGMSDQGVSLFVGPLLLAAASLWALAGMRRAGEREWLLYGAAIFVAPALMVGLTRFPTTYARYFLLPVFLSLLLLTRLLGGWWQRGTLGRVAAVSIMLLISLGNAAHFWRFLGGPGRGQYSQATARIVAETEQVPTLIGSDHDFRTRIVLEFYLRRDHPEFAFRYVGVWDWQQEQPDWLVLHTPQRGLFAQPRLRTPAGSFRLLDSYRHYGASGFDWFLYRRSS